MSLEVDPTVVGSRIRDIRTRLGLSMAAFAEKIDQHESIKKTKSGTVSNWETGKNLPNNTRLVRIAELGGISVNELLYGGFKAFCHEIFNSIENEKNDKGYPTLYAGMLTMLHYQGNNEKIAASFEQGYETIRDLNLSYEDDKQIIDIFKKSIELHFSDHEYTNDGVINFAIDYIHDLYDTKILDHFYFEIDSQNRKTSAVDSILKRENINQELYDEIKHISDEAISKLNKLKVKYSEIKK